MGCATLRHNVRSIAREASAAPAAKFKSDYRNWSTTVSATQGCPGAPLCNEGNSRVWPGLKVSRNYSCVPISLL
jgi:hypothetical protein